PADARDEVAARPDEPKDALPKDFEIAKRAADELASGGKPQDALAYWRRMFPPEKRSGVARERIEAEEAAIRRGVDERFKEDLARAAQFRKEGFSPKARRVYDHVKFYGGPQERSRAEQELAKLDEEESAAKAAGAGLAADARDKDTTVAPLRQTAPLARAGQYDAAAGRAQDVASGMKEGLYRETAKDAAKMLQEL